MVRKRRDIQLKISSSFLMRGCQSIEIHMFSDQRGMNEVMFYV